MVSVQPCNKEKESTSTDRVKEEDSVHIYNDGDEPVCDFGLQLPFLVLLVALCTNISWSVI